ncbi:hypothetical protein VTI28DRAFT_8448 [Corynascus sepedonium]
MIEELWKATAHDLKITGPSDHGDATALDPRDWVLEVKIGRRGGGQRSVRASNGLLLSRALNSACKHGLDKDPNYGDWILPCRYVQRTAEGASGVNSESSATAGNMDGALNDRPLPRRVWVGGVSGPSAGSTAGTRSQQDNIQAWIPLTPLTSRGNIRGRESRTSDEEATLLGSNREEADPIIDEIIGNGEVDAGPPSSGTDFEEPQRQETNTPLYAGEEVGDVQPIQPGDARLATDVISISSDSDSAAELNDCLSSNYSKDLAARGDGDDAAQKSVDPDKTVDSPILATITLGGTYEEWVAACEFFRYDPAYKRMDMGKQLFGTRNKLRPGQMHAVWHFLNATYNEGRTGYINALDTGLGKTMVALAIVAILRTVELMGLLCRRDPGNCKLSDHFGYQHCVCQSGSLISAIHSRLAQGITVFLTPNTAVEGAEEAARRFLEEVIQLPDGSNWDFVNVIGHESIGKLKGKLFGQPADTNIKMQVVKTPVLSGSRAKEAEFGNKKPKKNPFGSLNNDLKTYKSGADVQDIAIEYTANQKKWLFEERHFLLILPSNASSLCPTNSLMRNLSSQFLFDVHGRRRQSAVTIVLPFWVRLCILDEYHSIKNDDTIVYTAIKLLKRRHPPDPVRRVLRDMIVFFASATPITNDVWKSLDVPLKFIIPEAWNDRKNEKHATMSQARFKELVTAARGGNDTGTDRIFEAWKNYLAGFMIRRMVQSGFLGEPECALPRHEITKIDCSWNSLGSAERQEFASIVQRAKKSAGGDRADVAIVFSRLALSGGFLSQLYGATFVHPFRLRKADVGQETLNIINGRNGWQRWITSEHANNASYLTPEGRSQHPAMRSGAIDFLCKGNSKFAEIEKILAKAKADDSGPAEGFDYPRGVKGWEGIDQPIKKSVVLFCSRPGVAVLLALYADKHWSQGWNIHLLTSASKDRQQTIDRALRPVVFNDPTKKPSILIGVMSICGEGVNGMQNACYSVSVDLPFSEALRAQVRGRVPRYGQIHVSEHYELVSQHPAERIILARHEQRYAEIQGILEELEAGGGGGSRGLGPATT